MLDRNIGVAAVGLALLLWSTPNALAQQRPMPTFETPGLPAGPADCLVAPSLGGELKKKIGVNSLSATATPAGRPNGKGIAGDFPKEALAPNSAIVAPATPLANCGPPTGLVPPQWDPRGHAPPGGAIEGQLHRLNLEYDLRGADIAAAYQSCYNGLFRYTNMPLAEVDKVHLSGTETCLSSLAGGPRILEPVRRSIGILVQTKSDRASVLCTATQINLTTIVTALHCIREMSTTGEIAPHKEITFRPYRAPKVIAAIEPVAPPPASLTNAIIKQDPNIANRVGDLVFLKLAKPLNEGFASPAIAAPQATLDQSPATPVYFVAFNALFAFKGNVRAAAVDQTVSALLDGDWTVAMSYPDPRICMLAKGTDEKCLAHSCPAIERNSGGPLFQVQEERAQFVGVHSGNISVKSRKSCGVDTQPTPAFDSDAYRNLATPLAGVR